MPEVYDDPLNEATQRSAQVAAELLQILANAARAKAEVDGRREAATAAEAQRSEARNERVERQEQAAQRRSTGHLPVGRTGGYDA